MCLLGLGGFDGSGVEGMGEGGVKDGNDVCFPARVCGREGGRPWLLRLFLGSSMYERAVTF